MNRRNFFKSTGCLPALLIPDALAKKSAPTQNTVCQAVKDTRDLGTDSISAKCDYTNMLFFYSDLNSNYFTGVLKANNNYQQLKPWLFKTHDNMNFAVNYDQIEYPEQVTRFNQFNKLIKNMNVEMCLDVIVDRHINNLYWQYMILKGYLKNERSSELIII